MIEINNNSIKQYFILYFIIINIFCIRNIISENLSTSTISSLSYPQSLKLINGNILILAKDGFYFYDSLLTTLINSYKFDVEISDVDVLGNTILRQFSQNDKIIICFVSNYLFIFSEEGELISITSLSLDASFFSMTPFTTDDNNYYFFLCYENNDKHLQFLYYSINKTSKTLTKIYTFVSETREVYANNFSCLTMYYESEGFRLVCFINIEVENNGYKVTVSTFKIIDTGASADSNVQISQTNEAIYATNDGQSSYMKSAANDDLSKAMCCLSKQSAPAYCYFYDINKNELTGGDKYFSNCGYLYFGFNIVFYTETKEFIAACKNELCNFKILIFNENLEEIRIKNDDTFNWSLDSCSDSHTFTVIYEKNSGKYFMLTDNFYGSEGYATRYYELPDNFTGSENNEGSPSFSICPLNYFYDEKLKICIFLQKHYINKNSVIYLNDSDYCPDNIPYENATTKECISNCEVSSLIINECFLDNINENNINKTNEIIFLIINDTKFNDSVNLIIGEDYTIYQITNDQNAFQNVSNNISTIDLGQCGNILKNIYNITSILIVKLDIKVLDANSKAVKFELYNPETKEKLDLNYCSNVTIDIYSPAILSQKSIDMFEYGNSQSYDVFDSGDLFYNDLCTKFTSENGTDVILLDRKNNYYNENIILCEDNCEYKNYYIDSNKVQCECNIDENINQLSGKTNFVSQNLSATFFSKSYFSNLKVMKCYKLFFSISEQIKNLGSYILFIFIIFFIVVIVLFYYNHKVKVFRLIYDFCEKKNNGMNAASKPFKLKQSNKLNNKNGNNIIVNNLIFASNINNTKCNNNRMKVENKNIKKIKSIKKKSRNLNSSNPVKIIKSRKVENNFKSESTNKNISNSISKKFTNSKKNSISNLALMINKKKNLPKKNNALILYIDEEMNVLSFEDSLKFDKRNFGVYYWSLLKEKHLIILAFFAKNDYNLVPLKIGFLILSFCLYFIVNACFFTDSTMHNIYEVSGSWKIISHLPIMIYSNLISLVIKTSLRYLALSSKNILLLKKTNNKNILKASYELYKSLQIKFNIFLWLSFLLLLFFWYFIETFCAVYANTQKILIKDTLSSFFLGLIYPFGLNLLPAFFRIQALKDRKKGNKCLFKMSKILALI